MRVYINHGGKSALVEVVGVADAGWFGFNFAKRHRDLVEAGWVLLYFTHPSGIVDRPGAVEVFGLEQLVDKIHEGPLCFHSCPRHEALK